MFAVAVAISAVTGQPAEDDRPRSAGLPGAVAHAATAPDPPRDLTVIASIATAQENATSTPPTMGDTEGTEGQGAAQAAPSRPGRPSVSGITHSSITLSWGAVSGATHYDAQYRNRDAGGPGVPGSWSGTNGIDSTSYTFSGLSPSTRYEFEVRATNASGDSGWSLNRYGTTTARPAPLSLPDPSDRTLTKGVSTSFTLPLAKGGNAPYTHSASGLPTGLSFTASSRKVSGTPTAVGTSTVTYRVTDRSSTSRTQTFTITVSNESIPSAPGRPSTSGITHNSVSLSWGSVTGATHYDARYRDRDAGGSDIPGSWSQTNGISGTSKTFSGLSASTRYEFEVRAGNAAGDSNWSPSRYGTTTAAPTPTPTSVPTPAGTLSASPTTIFIGETTTLTSSNVTPSNTQVKLVYDTKLTHRDSCPEVRAASNHNTVTLSSPNSSVTFIGCWQGTADVTLRTVDGNVELDDVDITINTPSVSLSGLGTSLAKDESDPFDVEVSNISSDVTYRIEMLAGDSDLSFTDDCEDPDTTKQSGNLSGDAEHEASTNFTLYACKVGGSTVFASLLHGNRTIGLDSQYVTVTTPTPAPAPPPSTFTAPSNFRYEPSSTTSGQATFYWTAARNADSQKIEKHIPDLIPFDNDWHKVGSTLGSAVTQFTLSNISTDSVEEYRVTASKSGEDDKHSNVVEVRLKLIPQNLVATHAGHGRAKLTWDPVDTAQSYVIQRRSRLFPTEQYSDWPTDKIESGPALNAITNKVETVVKGLPPGEDSRFAVKAKSVHTLSEASIPSNTLRVTDDRPSGPPTGERWERTAGSRSIVLEWNDDSTGHSNYLVESEPVHSAVNANSIVNHGTDKKRLHIDGLPYNARYTFNIYAVNVTPVETVKSDKPATLSFTIPEPHYWWGHQADHTVKYEKGTISNSFIEGAIKSGAEAWNTRMGHNLLICDDETMGISCNSRMMDGGIVTIKTVATTRDTPSAGCGKNSMACVKPDGSDPPSSSPLAPGRHMLNMDMVFEAPGYSCPKDDDECDNADQLRILWTNDSGKHGKERPNGSNEIYVYVNYIMIHEFGHTLGMPDFYNDDKYGLKKVKDAVMNVPSVGRVTDEDLKQLNAIYRYHITH
ncbi:MAG: hypothetical protein F4W93_07715 [Dehalococcoidia bacterium]|nr:hypothetical protein [Dehalococcoidia bacterium]